VPLSPAALDRIIELYGRDRIMTGTAASGELLVLYAANAYEWDGYVGATRDQTNEARQLAEEIPLRNVFTPNGHPLILGIANLNGVSVQEAVIELTAPADVSVQIAGCWTRAAGDTYRCSIRSSREDEIPANSALHAADPLTLIFPQAEMYSFSYRLSANGVEAKLGRFTVSIG
jgi:hypothetical protein